MGQQLLLVNLGHPIKNSGNVGFFRAYRSDIVGLAVVWGMVVLLVSLAYAILQI